MDNDQLTTELTEEQQNPLAEDETPENGLEQPGDPLEEEAPSDDTDDELEETPEGELDDDTDDELEETPEGELDDDTGDELEETPEGELDDELEETPEGELDDNTGDELEETPEGELDDDTDDELEETPEGELDDDTDNMDDSGSDTSSQPDVSFGSLGDDDFSEINVEDVLTGDSSVLFTGGGNDFISTVGSPGTNRIYSGSGDDILIAGNEDRLFGQSGDDQFFISDQSDNILFGGAGNDTFNLANAEIPIGINFVRDFTPGEDIIGINGLDISFEDLTLTQSGSDTILGLSGQDFASLSQIDATTLNAEDFTFG